MRLDLHVHSRYSKDSRTKPETILREARKKGLDGVAVTDHNTIRGAVEAKKCKNYGDVEVIIGSEIGTEFGDIIGLFLDEEVASRRFLDAVGEIKGQGGIVVLAHPYRKNIAFPAELLGYVDMIEGFNARSPAVLNVKAQALAALHHKPMTAGSDAHLPFEIGGGQTIVDGDSRQSLLSGKTGLAGRESNFYLVHAASILIEKLL